MDQSSNTCLRHSTFRRHDWYYGVITARLYGTKTNLWLEDSGMQNAPKLYSTLDSPNGARTLHYLTVY